MKIKGATSNVLLHSVSYQYDIGGVNLTKVQHNIAGSAGWEQTYNYDSLNRLANEDTNVQGVKEYTYYDGNGNRDEVDDFIGLGGTLLQDNEFHAGTNRISQRNNTYSMVHDAAGNITDDGNNLYEFEYNERGRLSRSKVSNVAKEDHVYDGFGQRIIKINNPGQAGEYERVYIYGQQGELIWESKFSSSGVRVDAHYVWLNGVAHSDDSDPLSREWQFLDEVITYLHPDQLGTPRIGTKYNAETISWEWQSDAFGKGNADADPDGDGQGVYVMLRFPGQYFDGATSKHYNYYRTYDPSTGRYLESDPIGLAGWAEHVFLCVKFAYNVRRFSGAGRANSK